MPLIVKLLPDGSGRVRIHWLQKMSQGPIDVPEGETKSNLGALKTDGFRARIPCMPGLDSLSPRKAGDEMHLVMRSEEPRAVTCPECMATEEFKKALAEMELLVSTG